MLTITSAYRVHNQHTCHVSFFPDGQTMLTASHEMAEGEFDLACVVKVWEPSRGVLLSRRDYDYGPYIALSDDGSCLAWGGNKGQLRTIRCDESKLDHEYMVADPTVWIEHLVFLPHRHALIYRMNPKGQWWEWGITTNPPGRLLDIPFAPPIDPKPDGRWLALGSLPNEGSGRDLVHIWDRATNHLLGAVEGHETGTSHVAWHPTRPVLATCGHWKGGLKVWNISDIAKPCCVLTDSDEYNALKFLPDGRLITGGESGDLRLWDVDTGRLLTQVSTAELGEFKLVEEEEQITVTHDKPGVSAVAVSPDGRTIAAGTYGGAVAFYEVS